MTASVIILVQRDAPQAIAAIESLRRGTAASLAYEVIVLLNGADAATAAAVQRGAGEALVIVSAANLGFGGGCNHAARHARGRYVVFLNDDVLVDYGWLEALVATAETSESIAAVGSRIRFADGTLQEAGSIVWSDGTTMAIGRGLPADGPDWQFRRDVTYASACALLVRRTDFDAAGGFDEAYYPAYYEDVDLCLALGALGKRVVFEPRAQLVHFESRSSTSEFKSFLFRRNHNRLATKWRAQLEAGFERADPTNPRARDRAVARARGKRTQILVIDDRLPDSGVGSGFGRLFELIADLHDPRFAVRIFPTDEVAPDPRKVSDFEVEVITRDIETELRDPERRYAAAFISRPHNYQKLAALIRQNQPDCRICFDVEALFYRRLEQQARAEDDPVRHAQLNDAAERMRALEHRILREADRIVCISKSEKEVIEGIDGHAPVTLIAPLTRNIVPTPQRFNDREPIAIFVAGWMAGPTGPNADGLRWFCEEVAPQVRARAPHARILVTGGSPPPNVLRYASPTLAFTGYVADLRQLYAQSRVAISPLRFGAGVKIKTIEALQHGVPVVATPTGAEGLQIDFKAAIAVAEDPERFAAALITLLTDEQEWQTSREHIDRQLQFWAEQPSPTWADVCSAMLESMRSADASAS